MSNGILAYRWYASFLLLNLHACVWFVWEKARPKICMGTLGNCNHFFLSSIAASVALIFKINARHVHLRLFKWENSCDSYSRFYLLAFCLWPWFTVCPNETFGIVFLTVTRFLVKEGLYQLLEVTEVTKRLVIFLVQFALEAPFFMFSLKATEVSS